MSKVEAQRIQSITSEAAAAIARRSEGCLALLTPYDSLEGWVSQNPDVNYLVVQVHSNVDRALSVMLAAPSGVIPVSLRHVVDVNLAARYSWSMLTTDTMAGVTNSMKYVLSELVVRRLVGSAVEERHQVLSQDVCERYWGQLRRGMGRYREVWDAVCLLVSVALGDHTKAIERFERDLEFDLAAHENSSRTLAKLSYLLAKSAMGTADEAMRYGAKALLLVTQFNYLRWIAWDQEDARVDLVAVVLATQLYQEIVGPKAESTEAFFRDLSPEVVVARMQAEVVPRTP